MKSTAKLLRQEMTAWDTVVKLILSKKARSATTARSPNGWSRMASAHLPVDVLSCYGIFDVLLILRIKLWQVLCMPVGVCWNRPTLLAVFLQKR